MTKITAQAVSELRQRTGAGMMDCKKALEENGGDLDAAVEYLRTKGIAKMEKRMDRAASEGIVGVELLNNGASGIMVQVACETDFVARNDDFVAFVKALMAQMATSHAENADAFLAEPLKTDAARTVGDFVKEMAAKTGEATLVKKVVRFDGGPTSIVGMYRHHNSKLATLVQITASSAEAAQHEGTRELAKFLAEHITASAPIAVDRGGVPTEKIESEKRIAEEQAREAGKPDAMIARIAAGKVEAFLKDVTLLPQAWVRDPKQTIADVIKDTVERVGGSIVVDRFARFQLGVD